MQGFNTFIIAHLQDADQIDQLEHDHRWELITGDDPTRTHWCDIEHGLPSVTITSTLPDEPRATAITEIDRAKFRLSRHVIIRAPDKDAAENIRNLIHGGMLLGYPDPQNVQLQGWGVVSLDFPHSLDTEPFRHWFKQYDQTFYGCQVASRAWEHTTLIHSIEKYRFSLALDCFTPHSAHPRYGKVFDKTYPTYEGHVSACFAIVAAYSAVEELGLEVRSSAEKPRFIDKEWNPTVLDDLNERLRGANAVSHH